MLMLDSSICQYFDSHQDKGSSAPSCMICHDSHQDRMSDALPKSHDSISPFWRKLLGFVLVCGFHVQLVAASGLSLDPDGWTILEPAADTRIYYVDATGGDDSTAQHVDAAAVADPRNPGPVNAFKTLTAAANAARDGYPDWVLLKRGGFGPGT